MYSGESLILQSYISLAVFVHRVWHRTLSFASIAIERTLTSMLIVEMTNWYLCLVNRFLLRWTRESEWQRTSSWRIAAAIRIKFLRCRVVLTRERVTASIFVAIENLLMAKPCRINWFAFGAEQRRRNSTNVIQRNSYALQKGAEERLRRYRFFQRILRDRKSWNCYFGL